MSYVTFLVLLSFVPAMPESEVKVECVPVVRKASGVAVSRVFMQSGYGVMIPQPEAEHAAELAYCAEKLSLPVVLTPCTTQPLPGGGGIATCE